MKRTILLTTLIFATGLCQAQTTIALHDPGFENSATKDDANYRNWQYRANNLGTYDPSGTGSNESVWLIRGYTAVLADGQIVTGPLTGVTGSQYFTYATTSPRGAMQYVGQGVGTFGGAFELKADIGAPATATGTQYQMFVVGFDDPAEVTVDLGGAAVIAQIAGGTGGFELFSSGWIDTPKNGALEEQTFTDTFTGTYEYIGVMVSVTG
jgi:hypothetical protein